MKCRYKNVLDSLCISCIHRQLNGFGTSYCLAKEIEPEAFKQLQPVEFCVSYSWYRQ